MQMENGELAEANTLYRARDFHSALAIYERIARQPGWKDLVRANIVLCRRRIQAGAEGELGGNHEVVVLNRPPEIVVTMTTIRSRLQYVPKVIESLMAQTLRPCRIDLNISREPYLLDEGITSNEFVLPDLMRNSLLHVNWVPNIGPYRKIWRFIETYLSVADSVEQIFVTIDDDTLYPEYFLQRLFENYIRYDCVIAFRGRHIELDQSGLAAYNKWTRGRSQPSLSNLPTGKDGILYSTRFFTSDFLNLREAQRIAPTADDLWIKWHCALNGVPSVILNPEACTSDYKSFPLVDYDKTYRGNSLYALHNSSEAQNKNDISVEGLEAHFLEHYGYNLSTLLRAERDGSLA